MFRTAHSILDVTTSLCGWLRRQTPGEVATSGEGGGRLQMLPGEPGRHEAKSKAPKICFVLLTLYS